MGKCIFFLFLVDYGIHGIYSKELKDQDIFITNITSTYQDIPQDCKLVGAEFNQDYQQDSIHLNITDDGLFWIGATLGFKRNINTIGTKQECPTNKDDNSLDECNHQCKSYKYLNQGKTSFNCNNINQTDQSLLYTESCDKYNKFSVDQQHVLFTVEYRYVVLEHVGHVWLYELESCFEKRNFSFICARDEDIFITNTTSTYEDIPKDCKLVGAEFDQDYPTDSTRLNITDDGPFWIAATIGFKRNINPIGTKHCPKSKEDISLDKCNHQCQTCKYFNQGKTSCNCDNNKETDGTLLDTESCEKEDKVLCQQKVCVVYRRVFHEDEYLCGTYRYVDVKDVVSNWLYKPESCSEKRNFSFICIRGNITMSYNSSILSWYEAYQRCKDDGQDLLQISNVDYVEKYQDGRTYWVSFFRRTRISWGTAHGKTLCVAAFVSNGTLSLVSKLCSEDLPALCYSNQNDGDKTTLSQVYVVVVVVGVGCGVGLVVLVAVVAFVKCNRVRKLNKTEDIIRKQHELDKKKSTFEPMKDNEAAVARGCSAYSLAGAYSDPINNEPTGKENEGEGYDQVTYQQQHTVDKENIYDHMPNLI